MIRQRFDPRPADAGKARRSE